MKANQFDVVTIAKIKSKRKKHQRPALLDNDSF